MLPRQCRVTRGDEFRAVMRRGRRAGRRALVLHVLGSARVARDDVAETAGAGPARAGFVVGKAVGNAVVRHRVTRRLRHLLADRLPALPPGTVVVVRAQAPAANASSGELGADLDAALRRLGLGPTDRVRVR